MTRVLVCGGRDFNDLDMLNRALDDLRLMHYEIAIIQGGARGADHLASCWAKRNGIELHSYPADWNKHGKAAGPIRNQQMLDEGKPDMVIAFPGGRGTADMVARARKAGVRVHLITTTRS
jgi:phosphoribosylformylglycinamidine (FGAM) synthase-like amidotransferase family enzyme